MTVAPLTLVAAPLALRPTEPPARRRAARAHGAAGGIAAQRRLTIGGHDGRARHVGGRARGDQADRAAGAVTASAGPEAADAPYAPRAQIGGGEGRAACRRPAARRPRPGDRAGRD